MNDSALVGPAMVEPAMTTANRRLIEAMEAPPETGVESRLDELAGITWHYAREAERRPDPGRLRHLLDRLQHLEPDLEGRKRLLVKDAQLAIEQASAGLDAV